MLVLLLAIKGIYKVTDFNWCAYIQENMPLQMKKKRNDNHLHD